MDPQTLLNMIHESGVFAENWDMPTKKEKQDKLKSVREKLRYIKKQMKEVQSDIKARFDGRNVSEGQRERVELRPYGLIEQVIGQAEIALRDIETGTVSTIKPVGDVIYGSHREDYWNIGTAADAHQYSIELEYKYLTADMDSVKRQIQKEQEEYRNRGVLIFAIVCLVLSVTVLVLSIFGVSTIGQSWIGLLGLSIIIMLLCIFFVWVAVVSRRNLKESIKTKIAQWKGLNEKRAKLK